LIRIMLVDDHRVVRQGLRFLLEPEDDLAVVAEAATVAQAIEAARAVMPDIVIMDARLPDGSGVEACRTIRCEHPKTSLLMLTSAPDDEALYLSVMAGADGFVPKQIRGRLLVRAIRRLMDGKPLHEPGEIVRVLERMRARAGSVPAISHLTPVERRITELIATGATNREITACLELDEATVNAHAAALVSSYVGSRRAEIAGILLKHLDAAHATTAP
jgi:DNA-binding NarL/FixJ family response regulator